MTTRNEKKWPSVCLNTQTKFRQVCVKKRAAQSSQGRPWRHHRTQNANKAHPIELKKKSIIFLTNDSTSLQVIVVCDVAIDRPHKLQWPPTYPPFHDLDMCTNLAKSTTWPATAAKLLLVVVERIVEPHKCWTTTTTRRKRKNQMEPPNTCTARHGQMRTE